MDLPAFDLDGQVPRARGAEFDLTPSSAKRAAAPEFDLPPINFRMAWDLDILLQKAPVPHSEYTAWLRDLKGLATAVRDRDAKLFAGLKPIIDLQSARQATVTFGGHFKTGKSTLLNAALGRRVLPAADLPETGTICALRSGERDSVVVWSGDARREVPCTLEAIQNETSLIGEVGERRAHVHDVDQLEITLSGCGIPPEARWIDSPGINDTEEMNASALRAARQADVLVWVLSSRQPLSEVEMIFLAGYIAERGPTGVVFVLNAFLQENTHAAWANFLERKAPWIQDKVLHHAPDLGFTPEAPPHIAPVSGLGLFGDAENDFGRTELRRLLLGLGSPEVPRIRRSRLNRAAIGLRELSEELTERSERDRAAADLSRKALERARCEAELRRRDCENDLWQAIDRFYTHLAVNVRSGGSALGATITAMGLQRDNLYSRQLNEMLAGITGMLANGLIADVRRLAADHCQSPLSAADEELLRRLLSPGQVGVIVANMPANDQTANAAAKLDGQLRSILQPLGFDINPTVGAALGSTLGTHRETPEKRERDAAMTRQNVQEAAEMAIQQLESRREQIHAHCLRATDARAALPAIPDEFDDAARTEWSSRLLRLAGVAEHLATEDATL